MELVLILLTAGATACWATFHLGGLIARGPRVASIGAGIYGRRLAGLERRPGRWILEAAKTDGTGRAGLVLSLLILLRSGFLMILGVLGLALLAIGAGLAPALLGASRAYQQPKKRRWILAVLRTQAAGHLVAATAGAALQLTAGFSLAALPGSWLIVGDFVLAATVIWVLLGFAAGYLEAHTLIRRGVLATELESTGS